MSSSNQQTFPLVWFVLVDSVTGEPYKGTSADKVAVSSSADVADFRKAVKVENSSVLTGIDSSQIIVYKNKTAFEKRNATVDQEKQEPLKPSCKINGLGTTEEDALVVVVPSLSSSPELFQLEQEIKALKNSQEYQILASKNLVWILPRPTEEEKGEWLLLTEKLADLERKRKFYEKTIVQSVKKSDKTRKEYKKDTAIKDERLLLSDVAITMWRRFGFDCAHEDSATFGDLKRAAGFKNCKDVHDYFRKKARKEIQEDEIKESLTEKQWIWLIRLNQRVNRLLHDSMITNQDGTIRLVLEHDVYQEGVQMAEDIVRTLYGPEKKVDIKDATSDSSTSP
jgi:hypothetical protein